MLCYCASFICYLGFRSIRRVFVEEKKQLKAAEKIKIRCLLMQKVNNFYDKNMDDKLQKLIQKSPELFK